MKLFKKLHNYKKKSQETCIIAIKAKNFPFLYYPYHNERHQETIQWNFIQLEIVIEPTRKRHFIPELLIHQFTQIRNRDYEFRSFGTRDLHRVMIQFGILRFRNWHE